MSLISEGWFREQGKKGVLIPRFALRKRGLEQGLVRFTEGGQRGYLGKGVFVIELMLLTQISYENIIQALNDLKHEVLSHQVFLSCFSSAVRRGEVKGLTKSSLFRMTLAYFLLVPDAKEKFLRELEKQLKSNYTVLGKQNLHRMPD